MPGVQQNRCEHNGGGEGEHNDHRGIHGGRGEGDPGHRRQPDQPDQGPGFADKLADQFSEAVFNGKQVVSPISQQMSKRRRQFFDTFLQGGNKTGLSGAALRLSDCRCVSPGCAAECCILGLNQLT